MISASGGVHPRRDRPAAARQAGKSFMDDPFSGSGIRRHGQSRSTLSDFRSFRWRSWTRPIFSCGSCYTLWSC
jgi:hypothetical protein